MVDLRTDLEAAQKQLREATEREAAISEILRAISSSPTDVQPVLDAIAEHAARYCAAENVVILLLSDDRTLLIARAFHGPLGPPAHPLPADRTTLTGRAIVEERTIHVEDLQTETAEYPLGSRLAAELGFHTAVATPLLRDGVPFGAIILRRVTVQPFTDQQLSLLRTFAAQAVIAIENVRLFNETKEGLDRQTAISEILRVIASSPTDVQPVLDAIAESARRFCAAEDATVGIAENGLTRVRAHVGPMPPPQGLFVIDRTTVTTRSMVDGKTIQVLDLQAEEAEYSVGSAQAKMAGQRTTMATPLLREGKAIGAILLRRAEVRPFSEKQIELLRTFADQAAIAIENVRLFNETKEALEHQRAAADILYTISTSPTTDQPVLEAVAKNALRFCGAEDVLVLLVDGDMLKSRAHAGTMRVTDRQGAPITRVPLVRETVSGRATLESRTVHVPDIQSSDEFPIGRELGQILGEHANLAAPLLQQGKAMGAILLRRTDLHPFGDDEVALAEGFAAQAVIAIENVRLFNETKEALERQTAISDILRVISASPTDLGPVLDTVAENAVRFCGAEDASVMLLREDGYEAAAHYGPLETHIERYALDRGSVTGRAILELRTVHAEDVTHDDEFPLSKRYAEMDGQRTVLVAPLIREGKALGAIALRRGEPRPFTERQIELARTFADQAVIAIENVRLFDELAQKSRQLEAANRHKSEFLANMSHELRTPLNAVIGFSDVLIGGMAGQLDQKQTEYLQDIRSSGQHLLSLINDILDLSKVEAGRMELTVSEFSLRATLSNAVTMIRERAAGHGIGLDLSVEGIDFISADERKVKQILFNLLSNAVKFTPDGGTISVTAAREGDDALLRVRDSGIGIVPEDQDRIFEEFRQVGTGTSQSSEGTGLGLTLTKAFVELHGGRIWVESEVGKGSTFSFAIPLSQPASP